MAKPQSNSRHLRRRIRDEFVFDTIMELCAADATKTVRPEDIAKAVYPEEWQSINKRVRLFATKLAQEGYIHILRKGKPIDPNGDIKGIVRLQVIEGVEYLPRMPQDKPQANIESDAPESDNL